MISKKFADLLIWVLILFPLFLGGIWIQRPGLKVELTELSVPVLLVASLLFGVRHWVKLDRLSSFRFLRWLWQQYLSRTLWFGGIAALLYAAVSLRRHWAAESDAFDLGIFTQTLWSLVNGGGYVSSLKGGMNLFQDHQSPILWAFAPLFWVIQAPETLLVAQALILASGGYAVYLLARQYGGSIGSKQTARVAAPAWLVAALPLIYWASPAVRSANRFDFHPEVAMLPLFLFAITGLQSRLTKWRAWGFAALLAALACKESAGPVAAGIGLAWVLGAGPATTRAWTKRLGWFVAAAGVAVFLVDVLWVPRLFGTSYAYGDSYGHLSGLNFSGFLNLLFGGGRMRFLLTLLVPLGLLPLLGKRAALWAALPGIAMIFLSGGAQRLNTQFHYGIEPSVGLFWAACGACAGLNPPKRWLSAFKGPTAIYLLLALVLFGHGRSEVFYLRKFSATDHVGWMRAEVLPAISPTAVLSASSAWVPHLSLRSWVNQLPEMKRPDGIDADCVLIDPHVDNWPLDPSTATKLGYEGLVSARYHEVWSCVGVQILQAHGKVASCLVRTPQCEK